MSASDLAFELNDAISDLRLLDHPFYVRWEAGEVSVDELAAYAAQYRHFETALPGLLTDLIDQLPEGAAADLVRRNLADEQGNPAPHTTLFETFAEAVGAPAHATPTQATSDLLDTYRRLIASSGAEGLAGVVAYEMQAPAIAATKSRALRRDYGLDERATTFWDVHATMDQDHADWSIDALEALPVATTTVVAAARSAATAWWAFLDDREAEATRPA